MPFRFACADHSEARHRSVAQPGMTLQDWIARQVIAAVLGSDPSNLVAEIGTANFVRWMSVQAGADMAKTAYQAAEVLMQVRAADRAESSRTQCAKGECERETPARPIVYNLSGVVELCETHRNREIPGGRAHFAKLDDTLQSNQLRTLIGRGNARFSHCIAPPSGGRICSSPTFDAYLTNPPPPDVRSCLEPITLCSVVVSSALVLPAACRHSPA